MHPYGGDFIGRAMIKKIISFAKGFKTKSVNALEWFTFFVALSIPIAQLLVFLFPIVFYIIGVL
jgi:hypothetical protein